MLKIMEDIYFCESKHFLLNEYQRIKEENITHIILAEHIPLSSRHFKTFHINFNGESPETIPYRICPRVSDFLREVLLLKGKLLLVNN